MKLYYTTQEYFAWHRRECMKLILQDCRDPRAMRKNLRSLLAVACDCSVREGQPMVKLNKSGFIPYCEPSSDPEPDKKPTATDVLRLRGMGVRWN